MSGDQGSVENEYAYIDRAKLATFAHSEYSMARSMVSQFHDLAPYASTDILRQAQARVSGQPPLYQVNMVRVMQICMNAILLSYNSNFS